MQITLDNEKFLFDGRPTYDDNPAGRESVKGLLMNARFIQGLFDDAADPSRFERFGYGPYDPDAQTQRLIDALPAWRAWGLRALTVGLQGGGPCFTTPNETIRNNPFTADGSSIDDATAERLARLTRAADRAGLAVIVSFLYGQQCLALEDDAAVERAVATASGLLRELGCGNVIIEIANEHDVGPFRERPIVFEPYGVGRLIDVARRASGGLPVGCSGTGNHLSRPIAESSDVVLIHGNGCTRQTFANLIRRAKGWAPGKPIVCNEDSPAISNLPVAVRSGVSWGYYNNWTKQEPPTDFSILPGHDRFFAWRMAEAMGYQPEPIDAEEQFVLAGLGEHEAGTWVRDVSRQRRWPTLAALRPERVDRVDFYRDGVWVETCYDDPFAVGWRSNWYHEGHLAEPGRHAWRAEAFLRDGSAVVREAEAELA